MAWHLLAWLLQLLGTSLASLPPGDPSSSSETPLLQPRHLAAPPHLWRRTNCGSPASMNASNKVDIISRWGRQVTPENVKTLFEYPRPQMVRPGGSWVSLNGLWQFEACPGYGCGPPPFGRTLNETILVPFPVESCLSGLRNHSSSLDVPPTYPRMFYRTELTLGGWGHDDGKVLLHFGAVDWMCEVYVDGMWVGSHEGGEEPRL
jgi:hypothetical protein